MLTNKDKLLEAAHRIVKEGRSTFTIQDLTVAAWLLDKLSFGLKGYEAQYPDYNKVMTYVVGKRGLILDGKLFSRGGSQYSLTIEDELTTNLTPQETKLTDGRGLLLTKEQDKLVYDMLSSNALKKYEVGNKETIGWKEAAIFWGVHPRGVGKVILNRIEYCERTLIDLIESANDSNGTAQGPLVNIHKPKGISSGELRVLLHCSDFLSCQKFLPRIRVAVIEKEAIDD